MKYTPEFATYDEWQDLGYFVCFGQKSHRRDSKGRPLFSERQVRKKEPDHADWLEYQKAWEERTLK